MTPAGPGMRPLAEDDPRRASGFVFVVTYARSGSTLLQALLNAHPDVAVRGENNAALYHLYRAIEALRSTRADHGRPVTAGKSDEPWYGADLVEAGVFEARAMTAFVRRVLCPPPGTKISGFKEIRHNAATIPQTHFAPYMDFLLSRFPGSRIIFNSRRAEDVARSAFVTRQDPEHVMAWVADCDRRFSAYAQDNPRTIHLRYEDWVADHGMIHDMLRFAGVTPDADAVARVMGTPLTHGKRKD
jgi:Sulfotransferase family